MQATDKTRHNDVLVESIREHRHAILTVDGPQGWRTIKGEFDSGSPGSGTLTVRLLNADDDIAAIGAGANKPLGCTFRLNHKKCMFGTTITSVDSSSGSAVVALLWPDNMQLLQRRAYERSTPPPETIVAVRFWQENGSSTSSETRVVRHGQLDDISAGGMRIKVAHANEIELETSYRCAFTPRPGKPSFLLEAICRHREAVDQGRASLGFQFVGMEATADGRRMLNRLARLVNHFQRSRHRERR